MHNEQLEVLIVNHIIIQIFKTSFTFYFDWLVMFSLKFFLTFIAKHLYVKYLVRFNSAFFLL